MINNLLLSKCKGWTGEYWPKVVAVCVKWKEVCTKMTGGQYSSVWLKEARLVSRYYTVLGLTLLLLFFNCWHARWTLQGLWTFLWKWFLWQNPDQVRARLPCLVIISFIYFDSFYVSGDHTETLELEYDPNCTTYKDLLKIFWKNHNPTAVHKAQYMSAIFYHNEDQKQLAEETREEHQKIVKRKIVTKILPANTFYVAEQ